MRTRCHNPRPRRLRVLLLAAAATLAAAHLSPAAQTFTNPISPSGADPWVMQWKGQYLYVRSDGARLYVDRSTNLHQLGQHGSQMVYQPPAGTTYSQNLWAPELHYLDNKWYLYVAADDGPNANHRMHVLEGTSQDPQGTYVYKGQITDPTNRWAIDGSVMQLDGNKYFVWSGWPGSTDGQQNLYLAPMSNPWTIGGNRVQIAAPTAGWERHGLPINEGPTVLQRDGKTHIVYSGSGFWTRQYALGQLTLTPGADPLIASSWAKTSGPVFAAGNNVVGVGHASFTKSPDGGQDWIVYHAHNDPDTWTGVRDVRTQQFHWHGDDSPDFGAPAPSGAALNLPSGRAVVTFVPNASFERIDVTSNGSGGNALGVDKMKTTGSTGVTANDGRFHPVIAGGDGRQMGFIASAGSNGIYNEIGQIVKPGTYTFSAGVALSPTQLAAANAAPATYQLRLESVGLLPSGQPNENDKIVLGTQTVSSAALNGSSFTTFNAQATIPLLSDRYNSFLRLGIYSSGAGGSAFWSAKLDSFQLDFAAAPRPQTPAVAYWRFEEGPAGASLTGTAGDNNLPHTTTLDHAGGNDNLRTYNAAAGFDTSPKYSRDVPAAVVPATGAVNEHAFDFSPNQDVYTKLPGDLNGRHFEAFTVEASFKLDALDRYHGIVGKDGKPVASSALAPLQLKARDDNDRAQIEILDAAGTPRQVSSVDALQSGQWYHAAAVNDGATMSFYLDRSDGLGYVLQGTTPVSGALIDSVATWTVGRGFYDGNIADWTDGKIDEVRITDAALDPTQFLFFDPTGAPVWNVNAGGSWSRQSNWSRATPDSINAVAWFTEAIRAPRTIDVDAPRTVAAIVFRNAHGYTLAGTHAITLDTSGAAGRIDSLAGDHTIAAPVRLNRSTTIHVAGAASTLTISGDVRGAAAGVAVTKTGAGDLALRNIRAGSLAVTGGGGVRLLPNGSAAAASALDAIAFADRSKLDLADNKIVLHAMPIGAATNGKYAGVQGLVQGGTIFSHLAAAHGGLTTIAVSTGAQAKALGESDTALWAGQTISGSSILAMYTYAGDANLDGAITGDDYSNIDFGILFPGMSGYANGDFNYDGYVTGDDYSVIDLNILLQGAPFPTGGAAAATEPSVTAVPEPSAWGFALLAAAALATTRARRRPRPLRRNDAAAAG